MFEWLREEMERVKTRKFYVVDGPARPELADAVLESPLPLPPSYKAFVLHFGNAKLYRRGNYYLVKVFAGPREEKTSEEELIHFGRTDDTLLYFKPSLLVPDGESPVFEWEHGRGLYKTADGFEEWLRNACESARRRFTRKEWTEIEKGPPPFSAEERAIVEARKRFRWRTVGISENGDIQFEVHNGSDRVLPFLTLGVRAKDGRLDGGVWLPVFTVRPGETTIIEKGCYKKWLAPHDVEVFALPDPEPEDRDQFWEFKALSK